MCGRCGSWRSIQQALNGQTAVLPRLRYAPRRDLITGKKYTRHQAHQHTPGCNHHNQRFIPHDCTIDQLWFALCVWIDLSTLKDHHSTSSTDQLCNTHWQWIYLLCRLCWSPAKHINSKESRFNNKITDKTRQHFCFVDALFIPGFKLWVVLFSHTAGCCCLHLRRCCFAFKNISTKIQSNRPRSKRTHSLIVALSSAFTLYTEFKFLIIHNSHN